MGKLAALAAKTLNQPGRHGDGDGLYLNITPSGSKSWVQRIVIHGRRRDIGLGPYPAVSLARARSMAQENRSAVAEGRDPVAEKRQEREAVRRPAPSIPTFAEAATRVIEIRRPTWSNPKHVAQWQSTLHTLPRKAVDSHRRRRRRGVGSPETASRVRQRMETVMDWVVAQGHRLDNPAGRSLLKALPKTQRLKEHHQASPYARVPGVVRLVMQSTASMSTKLAFEFLVLTASRSGEVRGAEWSEIDWQSATWEIPAARMKARSSHRIPLSTWAEAILVKAWQLSGGRGLIFPSTRGGKPASKMAFASLLRRLEIPAVPDGFRTSFRHWIAECTPVPWAVGEAALAHNVGNSTEAAYMRSDLFDQRRTLMQDWADYVASELDTEGATAEPAPNLGDNAEAVDTPSGLVDLTQVLAEAQAACATGSTDTEGKTPERIRDDFLGKVLKGDIPGFQKVSDLASLWRETPAESLYASYPVFSNQTTLLLIHMEMAKKMRWAWDGLRSLIDHLLKNDKPVPPLLNVWGLYHIARLDPPPKRGRPEEFDRNMRFWATFTMLRSHGWKYEQAIAHIACLVEYKEETVRSIIRKLDAYLRLAVTMRPTP